MHHHGGAEHNVEAHHYGLTTYINDVTSVPDMTNMIETTTGIKYKVAFTNKRHVCVALRHAVSDKHQQCHDHYSHENMSETTVQFTYKTTSPLLHNVCIARHETRHMQIMSRA
jgi:hypothetical protein